jgi:hypothetical protein
MAASLNCSQRKGNGNMKRTKPSGKKAITITAHEALQILASAVSYCQQAGLQVQAANGADTLTLHIPNAYYTLTNDGTSAAFRLRDVAAHRADAPGVSAHAER